MTVALDTLPDDAAALKALIIAERAAHLVAQASRDGPGDDRPARYLVWLRSNSFVLAQELQPWRQ